MHLAALVVVSCWCYRLFFPIRLRNPKVMNKSSRLFWPVLVTPKNATIARNVEAVSRSQKLMNELGLIKSGGNGTFQIMPLAQRAIDKCVDLVHRRMCTVGGQKITLPVLTPSSLWKKSGRLDGDIGEFFLLRDRHGKEFLMSPTHEEAVTALLATAAPISHRQLPLRLYQVGPKFRDELKARFGLMRAKEFLMKDMYTFDRTNAEARDTYEQVNTAYEALFRQLEVPFVKVEACAGIMGGSVSHEFHYVTATGEDRVFQCANCGYASNSEVSDSLKSCPKCASANLKDLRGIEVGHAFLLGDKYSRPLGATFLNVKGKPEPLMMGCYGIGVSRLVAAALEVLSTESDLRWPTLLAPFDICIIGPKQGSKEQPAGDIIEVELCRALAELYGNSVEEVLHDDRKSLTIGKRLLDAKRMGYPLIVVIGANAVQNSPKLELHMGDTKVDLSPSEVLSEIAKYKDRKLQLLNQ